MLTMNRTFTDFNGNKRTEEFRFNLTKAEALDLECTVNGGLSELLKRLDSEQDRKELILIFKKVIDMSYGEKSLDGREFKKSAEILAKFKATNAYADIYFELATDADKASAFINGVIPKDEIDAAVTAINEKKANSPTVVNN